eukprot:SAG31_NODE_41736_length_274_cov_1.691429_1_plen_22_part_01
MVWCQLEYIPMATVKVEELEKN